MQIWSSAAQEARPTFVPAAGAGPDHHSPPQAHLGLAPALLARVKVALLHPGTEKNRKQ